MPLVTRSGIRGIFVEATEPSEWLDGDVWSDTTANIVKNNVGGTATDIGHAANEMQTLTNKTIAFGDNTLTNVMSLNTAQTISALKTYTAGIINSLVTQSMSNYFNLNTAVPPMRFTEWMYGSVLSTRWTQTDTTGTNAWTMADNATGGLLMTTSGGATDDMTTSTNSQRVFLSAGCRCLFVITRTSTTNTGLRYGMRNAGVSVANTELVLFDDDGDGTFIAGFTADDSATTTTATAIAVSTAMKKCEIDIDADAAVFIVDGVTGVTITTTLPTLAGLEPNIRLFSRTSTTAKTAQCRRVECWNV